MSTECELKTRRELGICLCCGRTLCITQEKNILSFTCEGEVINPPCVDYGKSGNSNCHCPHKQYIEQQQAEQIAFFVELIKQIVGTHSICYFPITSNNTVLLESLRRLELLPDYMASYLEKDGAYIILIQKRT